MIARQNISLRTVAFAVIGFSICSIAAAVRSHGFLESDGGTHYLFARYAFQTPAYFVDVWGRPLCTTIYAIGARLGGLIGVRFISLALAIGCGLVAMAIAAGQNFRWPALALIFTLGEPLVFLHSFSELTELPFALVAGLALLAYQNKRWGAMAWCAAIAPLGRPEGFALLPAALVALIAHRQWKWIWILPIGLLAWSLAGHFITGPSDQPWWKWLSIHWPYEKGSAYQPGNLLHFVGLMPAIVGPFAMPAMWIGMGFGLSFAPKLFSSDHLGRVRFLIAAGPLAVLAGHSVLYWRGMLSSNGEPRYLLVCAPLWGVLAASAWEWIFLKMHWRRPLSWAALAVVAPGAVNCYWRVLPVGESTSWAEARQMAQWYDSSPVRQNFPRILTNHPGIYVYMDVNPADPTRVEQWKPENFRHPTPGVLLFWDPVFSVFNSNPRQIYPLALVRSDGWIEDLNLEHQAVAFDFRIFRAPADATTPHTPSLTTASEKNCIAWSLKQTS